MDFTKVLNEFWFNIILGFNSTFLSGLDMVFTKNGFGLCVAFAHGTLRDIQCATSLLHSRF